ncbi:hypothetical protein [Polaromonas sp. YR568]|uniref:hypothetical protein n=1 Tax=Polaromonas sp. YR568 TaxID=1855301 RepID=UPI00398BE6D5
MKESTSAQHSTSTRRAWLARASCLVTGLVHSHASWAGEPDKRKPVTRPTSKTPYLVSAVLREGVQDFTFRLVHSVQSAAGIDEATGLFTRLVLEKYPGYAVSQTTATDIAFPPDTCALSRQAVPRKPARTLYAVSVVFSKNQADLDTLLVNGWLPSNNADEALGRVLRDVTAKYPGFTPASTLVTVLDPTLAGCPPLAPMRIHGERV